MNRKICVKEMQVHIHSALQILRSQLNERMDQSLKTCLSNGEKLVVTKSINISRLILDNPIRAVLTPAFVKVDLTCQLPLL